MNFGTKFSKICSIAGPPDRFEVRERTCFSKVLFVYSAVHFDKNVFFLKVSDRGTKHDTFTVNL